MNAPLTAFESLRTHAYAYPLLEVGHILGMSVLLGNLALLELRVWGVARELPMLPLARLTLVLMGCGFVLAATTGFLMFISQPFEWISNRAFLLKLTLLSLAAANAAWFHVRNSLEKMDRTARLQTLASALIWMAVVVCGRWMAYL